MAFGKLDDRLFLDERIQRLLAMSGGHAAFALHIAGISYAAGELTDGKLTPAAAECAARLAHVELSACTPLLEEVGVWRRRKEGINWFIRRYLEHNPTAATVREKRRKTAARVAAWREANAKLDGNADCNALQPMPRNASVTPPPSHPIPSHPIPVVDRSISIPIDDPPIVPPGGDSERPRRPRRHRPMNTPERAAELQAVVRQRMAEMKVPFELTPMELREQAAPPAGGDAV